MSTPKKPLVYPYRWCAKRIEMFVEKYARATYLFGKCIGLSAGEVRHFLTLSMARGNSLQFESFKRAVKVFSDYTVEDIKRYSEKERKLLHKWIVSMCVDDELDERIAVSAIDNAQNHRLGL